MLAEAEVEGVLSEEEVEALGLLVLAMVLCSLLAFDSDEVAPAPGEEVEAVLLVLALGEELNADGSELVLASVRLELEEFVEPKEEPVDDGEVALEAAGSELLLLARELVPESEALEDDDDDALSLEVEAAGAEAVVVEAEPLNGLALLASAGVEIEAEP